MASKKSDYTDDGDDYSRGSDRQGDEVEGFGMDEDLDELDDEGDE
jgi:hypothetical protein